MNTVFEKLQLEDTDRTDVRGAPSEFRPHLDVVAGMTRDPSRALSRSGKRRVRS